MCPLYIYNAHKGQGVPVHALQIYRGVGGSDGAPLFTVVLDGRKWSASRSDHFTPKEILATEYNPQ
jgi:hypothetical protein